MIYWQARTDEDKGTVVGMVIGLIVGLSVCALVVAFLFVLITRGTRALFGPRRRLEEEFGLAPLRGRLERGEITQEQFDAAERAIVSSPQPR